MSEGNFTISDYRLSAATYSSFFVAYLRRKLLSLRRMLWTVAYMALLLFITISTHQFKMNVVDLIIAFTLAFAVMYLLVPAATYIVGIIRFATGKMPKVSHNLSIDAKAVTESSSLATVTIPWSALYAVDQTRSAIFFFTNRSCAIMIPKSAFPSSEAAQDFLSTAQSYWQLARA